MRAILLIAILFSAMACHAGERVDYNVANISPALLKQANAVIRNRDIKVRVVSPTEIYTYEKVAVTVVDDKGADAGRIKEHYNKLVTIEEIKATLYDKGGKEIKRAKKRDMQDMAAYGEGFVVDTRYKSFDFQFANYPYTIEYEIERKVASFFFVLDWELQPDYNCAVERTTLEMNYPAGQDVKYKLYHISEQPQIRASGEQTVFSLTVVNLPATKKDAFAVSETYPLPAVVFSTNKLEMGGITGTLQSWNGFGKFYYDLNKERDVLPEERLRTVHELTDTCRSTREKVDVLYRYLQKNTRYVSIQLGIGGWQTLDATFVSKTGYGDCKALSNYMMALLKEAGIPAYQALVYGGRNNTVQMDLGLASNVFNHVILCVPIEKDTVWLECTSGELPAGYLSDFTHDRHVLLITPAGGSVVRTPRYSFGENKVVRKVQLKLKESGELTGGAAIMQCGRFGYKTDMILRTGTSRDKEKLLNEVFNLPAYKVDKYEYDVQQRKKLPAVNERMQISGSAVVTNSGKRIFFDPVITEINMATLIPDENRVKPFSVREGYEIIDTTVITLDGKYEAEHLPKTVIVKHSFGEYEYLPSFENGNTLTVIRRYRQIDGVYQPELYSQFVKFANNAGRVTEKVVLVKKES